ncbi:MAG TPA: SDR family oxidoreductase [Solimonas sp.]|nr:SDR family oxidoreductase [Solimonas sp.]
MNFASHLPRTVLIAGCGDIGLRAGRLLREIGREVTGLVRTEQSAARISAAGLRACIADLDQGAPTPAADLLLYLAPPPATGDTDPRLRAFLGQLAAPPQRLVYISTSGVYGDCQGRWITEDEPLRPQSARAARRLDAETALADYAQRSGAEVVTLRVPGIYGPGRLPLARLRQGLPVIRPDESPYSNRIHAEDLARALLQAAGLGRPGAAYNIADGHPTTMADYFTRCARLLGLPEPPQVSLAEARRVFTPAMWSFIEESRRLRIGRARAELGFEPRYPDLAAGLPACLPPAATIASLAGEKT